MRLSAHRSGSPRGALLFAGSLAAALCWSPAGAHAAAAGASESTVYHIFESEPIQFGTATADTQQAGEVTTEDGGRVIVRTVHIEPPEVDARIVARVVTRPIPKDEVSVHDPWDRAGNVRLAAEGGPDVELVKFVTAYGGVTEHEADVTHLARLLRGPCTFKGFVDTWIAPAWTMEFSLSFERADPSRGRPPTWVKPLLYEESADAESLGADGYAVTVDVPEGTEKAVLHYLSSGHCTDGTDEDEFVSKDNVISVDNIVVERYRPWREDCRDFRAVNPYTRRWSNGIWSSDYARSGWCPGDYVPPITLDLTDHLTPGRHVVSFNIEGVRPKGEDGHLGYWRISSYLVGWGGD